MGSTYHTAAAVAAVCVAVVNAPVAQSFPVVGGQGLTPNARAVVDYIQATYPGVQSIGGIRPCDAIGEHCRGVAVDIMIGNDMALGDAVYADLSSHMAEHAIKYLLWRVPNHYNHVHATVF
jgi:peptidoglycan DL-endopeptidase CwlO